MPKYYQYMVAGYYLYFTSHCIVEAMHVHAGNPELSAEVAAKFFVRKNGDTELQKKGSLSDKDISKIRSFIKKNYKEMYQKWRKMSSEGFYGEE
ncbi:MAG: DUF4160 domain-containing protein [Lachnospiraceae bacterium]|nr:DUF4160 domain-containing protein [Lachnospiraceae bacterium]